METNKRYWLRGAILFLVMYFGLKYVAYGLIGLLLSVPLSYLATFPFEVILKPLLNMPYSTGSMAVSAILIFLDGALWGFLYGKFRDRISAMYYLKKAGIIIGLPVLALSIAVSWTEESFSGGSLFGGAVVSFCLALFFSMIFKHKSEKVQNIAYVTLSILALIGTNVFFTLANFN
ncbi:MAG: hypothetical protein AB200_01525 [Parcubacteria bacterium C7867-005]|nr:MAG: hypothetical protein AB200_01525 [Parcubacteria bacterium C7867-005]